MPRRAKATEPPRSTATLMPSAVGFVDDGLKRYTYHCPHCHGDHEFSLRDQQLFVLGFIDRCAHTPTDIGKLCKEVTRVVLPAIAETRQDCVGREILPDPDPSTVLPQVPSHARPR